MIVLRNKYFGPGVAKASRNFEEILMGAGLYRPYLNRTVVTGRRSIPVRQKTGLEKIAGWF